MPAPLNALEKFVMMKLNMGPAPFVDLIGGFSFYAISAALKLNLFEEMSNGPMTVSDLADTIKCDKRGLDILLEVLEPLGYVKKKGEKYQNSKMTSKWMMEQSDINFKCGFNYYFPTMKELWPYIEESVRNGAPHQYFYDWISQYPEVSKEYQLYMMSLGRMIIPELVKKIKLKHNCKLLDIGGSHGLYSIALSKKYSDASITIIDSEYAMPLLKENIQSNGLTERIKIITADFINKTIEEKYDAILLFNVLHEHNVEDNNKIIKKIAGTLNPGGSLIVLEGVREKKMTNSMDLFIRMYGLMFYHFLGGQNYTFQEIRDMLKTNGFKRIKRKNLYMSGFTLIVGYI